MSFVPTDKSINDQYTLFEKYYKIPPPSESIYIPINKENLDVDGNNLYEILPGSTPANLLQWTNPELLPSQVSYPTAPNGLPAITSAVASAAMAIPGALASSAIQTAIPFGIRGSLKVITPLARLALGYALPYATPINILAAVGMFTILNKAYSTVKQTSKNNNEQQINNHHFNPAINVNLGLNQGNFLPPNFAPYYQHPGYGYYFYPSNQNPG